MTKMTELQEPAWEQELALHVAFTDVLAKMTPLTNCAEKRVLLSALLLGAMALAANPGRSADNATYDDSEDNPPRYGLNLDSPLISADDNGRPAQDSLWESNTPVCASTDRLAPIGKAISLKVSSEGILLATNCPRHDFEIEFEVTCTQPGSVFDTVGLNAAPVGSWSITIGADYHLSFNVWDGRKWHPLVSRATVRRGTPTVVKLVRQGTTARFSVDGKEDASLSLTTPLSGRPVFVGDFKGDETWGPKYTIHQGLVGMVKVLHMGKLQPQAVQAKHPEAADNATPRTATKPTEAGMPSRTTSKQSIRDARLGETTLFQFKAGKEIASRVIGTAGGVLEVPASIRVEFPAGALAADEKVAIRQVSAPGDPGKSRFFSIERSGGKGLMAHAAKIDFLVPEGIDPANLVMVQEIAPGIFATAPKTFDAATRKASMEVLHFSIAGFFGWDESLNTRIRAGAIAVVVFRLLLPELTAVQAVVIGCGSMVMPVVGWYYDANKRIGMTGPFTIDGFSIWWDHAPFLHCDDDGMIAWVDRNGVPVYFASETCFKESADCWQKIVPSGSSVTLGSLTHYRLPTKIMSLACDLAEMRHWYSQDKNLALPPCTSVLLKDKCTCGDLASWAGRLLHLHAECVDQGVPPLPGGRCEVPKKREELLGSISHEYWHAICSHNGYGDTLFSGAAECTATIFENVIFPEVYSNTDFANIHNSAKVKAVLAGGLFFRSAAEDALLTKNMDLFPQGDARGYGFWPFGKFVYHQHGLKGIIDLVEGKLKAKDFDALFRRFVTALLTTEERLGDYELPDGQQVVRSHRGLFQHYAAAVTAVATGWDQFDLQSLAMSVKEAGVIADSPSPRPCSLKLLFLNLPPRASASVADVVVRRQVPVLEEDVIALPPTGGSGKFVRPALFAKDLLIERGALAISGTWFGTAAKPNAVAVALVGRLVTLNGNVCVGAENSLAVYRLSPPSSLQVSNGDHGLRLEWTPPELGKGLECSTWLAGYQIYGEDAAGKEVPLAMLHFPAQKPIAGSIPITASQREVDLPAQLVAGMVAFGIASVDGAATRDDVLLTSVTCWARLKLTVDPPSLSTNASGSTYNFTATATGIPKNVTRVECEWDFGQDEGPVSFYSTQLAGGRYKGGVTHRYMKEGNFTNTVRLYEREPRARELLAKVAVPVSIFGTAKILAVNPSSLSTNPSSSLHEFTVTAVGIPTNVMFARCEVDFGEGEPPNRYDTPSFFTPEAEKAAFRKEVAMGRYRQAVAHRYTKEGTFTMTVRLYIAITNRFAHEPLDTVTVPVSIQWKPKLRQRVVTCDERSRHVILTDGYFSGNTLVKRHGFTSEFLPQSGGGRKLTDTEYNEGQLVHHVTFDYADKPDQKGSEQYYSVDDKGREWRSRNIHYLPSGSVEFEVRQLSPDSPEQVREFGVGEWVDYRPGWRSTGNADADKVMEGSSLSQ